MKNLRAVLNAALFLFLTAFPVVAEDIRLRSLDGSVEISGTLLGFDGEHYRVDTEYGVLTIDGSGVNCEGPGCPSLGSYVADLVISGSRDIGEVLLPALIEGFARHSGYALKREEIAGFGVRYTLFSNDAQTPVVRFSLRLTTSDEGFADMIGEQADFVLSMREATKDEIDLAEDAGMGDLGSPRQSRVLAFDALLPVVSPQNPVGDLSMEELTQIYSGKVKNWQAFGGEDAPVTAYLRPAVEGFGKAFLQQVLARRGAKIGPDVLEVFTNQALTDAVQQDPFGIGIASLSQPGNTRPILLSGKCEFRIRPTIQAIKTGDYPLSVPLFLYTPERRLPKAGRDFLSYIRSNAAQMVIRRAGFIDQGVEEIPVSFQGDRLANAILSAGEEIALEELQRMLGLMVNHARLSVTFRFRDGSSKLDGASRSNVLLLAEAIASGKYQGREVFFVGFSDGGGAASGNMTLAQRRAERVRDAVLRELEDLGHTNQVLKVDAFGEALPLACDDDEWGRRINRRVEVWVR